MNLQAQEPAYWNYGVEDGLPSSEVYNIAQDHQGYLWFATDHGVSRFDGYTFKGFTKEDGLPDNDVFRFSLDAKGRLWASCSSRRLAYFEGQRFIQPAVNDKIERLPTDFKDVSKFEVISEKELYFSFTRGVPTKLSDKGTEPLYDLRIDSIQLIIHPLANGAVSSGSYGIRKGRGKRAYSKIRIGDKVIRFPFPGVNRFGSSHVSRLKNGDLVAIVNEYAMKIRDGEIVQTYKLPAVAIDAPLEDDHGHLWIGLRNGGALCFADANFQRPPRHYLKEVSITCIFQDNEGGFWFSSLGKGVFYAPGLHFIQHPLGLKHKGVSRMVRSGNRLILGGVAGTISEVSLDSGLSSPRMLYEGDEILGLSVLSDGRVLSRRVYESFFRLNGKVLDNLPAKVYSVFEEPKGSLLLVGYHVVLEAEDVQSAPGTSWYEESRIRCSHLDPKGLLWLGTSTGYRTFHRNTGTVSPPDSPLSDVSIRCFSDALEPGEVLIGTKGSGAWLVKEGVLNRIDRKLNTTEGIVSFNALMMDEDGVIWAGSNKGLFKFTPVNEAKAEPVYTTRLFNHMNGLGADEIYAIARYDQRIYLATSGGLISFDPNSLPEMALPAQLFVTDVEAGGQRVEPGADHTFDHTQNFLRFTYYSPSYANRGKIAYRYRLKGVDDDWVYTKSKEALYQKLAPGDYVFEVQAMNRDEVWSEAGQSIAFSISSPFWQKAWFQGLVIFGLLGMAALFVYVRIQVLKKERSLAMATLKAEQKALKAQMNPHFIFNALNSIQNFITQSDNLSAQRYLSVFASMIRTALNHSNQEAVSLTEEVELLKKYVELETLRLDFDVRFEIDIDPELNPYTVKIPPMLVQPFLENAIWHGLQPKGTDGHIRLSFQGKDVERLRCEIEDNGIGISAAKSNAPFRRNREPSGMAMTEDRIKLLWQKLGSSEGIEVIELLDEQGRPRGTKIKFEVPVEF